MENRPKYMLAQPLVVVVSYAVSLLFMYAAISKLVDYDKFVLQLGQSALLTRAAGLIAWAVPFSELVIAVLLILERFRWIGLYACFSLLVMFTAYIFIILHYTDTIPCSCGGILEDMGWGEHMVMNIVFVLLTAAAIVLHNPVNAPKNPHLLK